MTVTVADTALVDRVVRHVRAAQDAGTLPVLSGTSGTADETGLLRPLHALIWASRADADPTWDALADALACACFGAHHLWQDLGASGRDEVSRLMRLAFPTLHDSNRLDLRWKRHLFLVLGEQLGRTDLRPPKCDGCDHHLGCFGTPNVTTIPLRSSTP